MKNYLGRILKGIKDAFYRFPIEIVAVIISTIVLLLLTGEGLEEQLTEILHKTLLSLILFFFTSLSISIFSERFSLKKLYKYLLILIAAILTGVYYNFLPGYSSGFDEEYFRYFLFVFTAIMLLFSLPVIKNGQKNLTWSYFAGIIFSFLISLFYSLVLFVGLAVFFAALEYLFGISIEPVYYARLAITVFILLGGIFFLSSIPQNLEEKAKKITYPKYLKILGQYIFMILILVYAAILYAYSFKILLTHSWPTHSVVWLIIWFGFIGILTSLILHPLKFEKETKGVHYFLRRFRIILLPLMILYFRSLSIRVMDYGFTVNRYLVLVFGIWLVFFSFYMIFSKKQRLYLLPFSLLFFAVIISFGPQGVLKTSERNQVNRLESALEEANALKNGKIVEKEETDNIQNDTDIKSVLSYLLQNHGLKSIDHLLPEKVKEKTEKESSYYSQRKIILDYLGVEDSFNLNYFNIRNPHQDKTLNISEYDYLIDFRLMSGKKQKYDTGKNDINISLNEKSNISLQISGEKTEIQLKKFVQKLREEKGSDCNQCKKEDMTIERETPSFKTSIILENISGRGKEFSINRISGKMLLKKK